MTAPLLTVGVPVYNGAKLIARALDSVLSQDYPNLEIVISDNASTDGTSEICQRYAAADPRIRYSRNEVNRGVVWNFNRLLDLANGKYFMWAAHDDQRAPSFVRKCVEVLESDPDAAVCQSHVSFIVEGYDGEVCRANLDSFRDKTTPVSRFKQVLSEGPITAIYGVLRMDAVRKTHRLKSSIGSDVAFCYELALYGNFRQVEEPLFTYYQRAEWNDVKREYRMFNDGKPMPWWYFPFVTLFRDQASRIQDSDFPMAVKAQLFGALVKNELRDKAVKALVKPVGWLCPEPYKETVAQALYWRLLHTPNIEAEPTPIYVNRIIKPMVGWWRHR